MSDKEVDSPQLSRGVRDDEATNVLESTRPVVDQSSRDRDLGLAMVAAIRQEDVQRILAIQNKSLKNISKTNELLGQFNDFSSSKYDVLQHMFLQHTRLLVDLKRDLTNVFLRIRRLKAKLQKQYPQAFEATFNLCQDLDKRLEEEEIAKPTYVSNKLENITSDQSEMKIREKNVCQVMKDVATQDKNMSGGKEIRSNSVDLGLKPSQTFDDNHESGHDKNPSNNCDLKSVPSDNVSNPIDVIYGENENLRDKDKFGKNIDHLLKTVSTDDKEIVDQSNNEFPMDKCISEEKDKIVGECGISEGTRGNLQAEYGQVLENKSNDNNLKETLGRQSKRTLKSEGDEDYPESKGRGACSA